MNYQKLMIFSTSLRTEEINLKRDVTRLSEQITGLRRRIKNIEDTHQLLGYIHQKIFVAAFEGKEHVSIFLAVLSPSAVGERSWTSIHEAHTSIERTLCEVGIIDLHVETIDQFRIRRPLEIITSIDYDTVVSFPLSQD